MSLGMVPDAQGRFGPYGGRYVPETLMEPLRELEAAYAEARRDASFRAELAALLEHVLHAPDDAPPGAVRMTLTTATLLAWLAGVAPSPQDSATLTRLHDALRSGQAAATLRTLRACCTA